MNHVWDEKKESGDYILTTSHDEYTTHYLIELDNGQIFHIDVGKHKPRVFINERPHDG